MKLKTMVMLGALAYGAYRAYREAQEQGMVSSFRNGRTMGGGI